MKTMIGFQEAFHLVQENVPNGKIQGVDLPEATGRVLAEDVFAKVDSPSVDISLKDGYALCTADVTGAAPNKGVPLCPVGFQAAGDRAQQVLEPGTTIRVTTGARVPHGADAVLPSELAQEKDGKVWCFETVSPGRNILPRGTDVKAGHAIAREGERLHPGLLGLLAAAGLGQVRVVSPPQLAVIATGNEVVAPGQPLRPGALYASNCVETMCWLKAFGFPQTIFRIAPDRKADLAKTIKETAHTVNGLITSGGAWQSERDLMVQVLDDLGWHGIFHRVRLGPGKAMGFGLLEGRPFFILPGGPPSHEAAFLLLALPGLLSMAGWRGPAFPTLSARLEVPVEGKVVNWTQVIHSSVHLKDGQLWARPMESKSRLSSMARKDALIILPEGISEVKAGGEVELRLLSGPGEHAQNDCYQMVVRKKKG
jgi:molybdopterin molybdotransferase